MTLYMLSTDTVLFHDGKNAVFSHDGNLLKLTQTAVVPLVLAALQHLRVQGHTLESLQQALKERFKPGDVKAIWDMLLKYGALREQTTFVPTMRPWKGFCISTSAYANLSEFTKDIERVENTHQMLESCHCVADSAPENTHFHFFLDFFENSLLSKLNSLFLKQKRSWSFSAGHRNGSFFAGYIPFVSPCFTCQVPFHLSDTSVNELLFCHSKLTQIQARELVFAVLARLEAADLGHQKNFFTHITQLSSHGSSSQTLRIRQPFCPDCSEGD
jgi:uncharacterized membrane protein (DUF2068 family)